MQRRLAVSTMTISQLLGRCFCGDIRYHCGAPLYAPTLCHCESCRRICGAHSVAWLTVDVATLLFESAKPREFSSSPHVYRSYCRNCGTPLTYRRDSRPGEIDIIVSTLNVPDAVRPIDHIWMEDALPWDRPNDGLPQYPQARP